MATILGRTSVYGQILARAHISVPIIQPIQIEFAWQYLVLAVDVVRCKLYWAWADRMNQSCPIPIFKKWMPDAVIWDGASAHRSKAMGEVSFERVFEWLRARLEGQVYATLQHKRCEIEHQLRRLNADKGRLKSLIGWEWIQDALAQSSA